MPAGRRVVLVGTGALASDLSAALADDITSINGVESRSRAVPDTRLLSTAAVGPTRSIDAATLIVAAPAPQTDIDALAGCYPRILEVIDLRGRHDRQSFASDCRLITLDDLFREASHAGPAADRIAAARRDIRELSRAFADRDELRPFGWDDLCA